MWIRATMPPTISLEAGIDTVARIRNVIGSYPPVHRGLRAGPRRGRARPRRLVPCRILRSAEAVQPVAEGLEQRDSWSRTSERLNREFVGIDFNFSQYIQDNIEEAVSGVKGENSIKIFGRDLGTRAAVEDVKSESARCRACAIAAFNLLGQPNLVIRINRVTAARYGFSIGDINAVIQAAIGGQEVTRVYEGEMNFALTVRSRRNPARPGRHPLHSGRAAERRSEAPAGLHRARRTRRGQARRARPISIVRTPALHSAEIQRARPRPRLDRGRGAGADRQERALPQGYRLEWSGEFGALQEAKQRLAFIVPLSLLLILMLLYSLFNSVRDSLLALSGIPFAVAGGILGLYVADLHMSVSAAVGFISLFGVVRNGRNPARLLHPQKSRREGMNRRGDHPAGETRMRQMTAVGYRGADGCCCSLLRLAAIVGSVFASQEVWRENGLRSLQVGQRAARRTCRQRHEGRDQPAGPPARLVLLLDADVRWTLAAPSRSGLFRNLAGAQSQAPAHQPRGRHPRALRHRFGSASCSPAGTN